jgi:hypothetical protein
LLKIGKIKRKVMKKTHDGSEIIRSFFVCLDGNGELDYSQINRHCFGNIITNKSIICRSNAHCI